MDEKDKERMRQRYLRGMHHEVDYEEQKARKARRRPRRSDGASARKRAKPRWDPDDDEEAGVERIGRRRHLEDRRVAAPPPGNPVHATVIGVHRGRVVLEPGGPARLAPHLAADPGFEIAVGDQVHCSDREGRIRVEQVLPRRSELTRPDPGRVQRRLVLAANIDLGVIVAAVTDPPLRPGLIDRFLVALQVGGVAPLLCINKVDLCADPEGESLAGLLAPYRDLGVPAVLCSATTGQGIAALRRAIAGATCVFVGHSGVGKSSLLNAIDPGAARSVAQVRPADGRGRHTTTATSLRELADGSRVIDTPGIRAFGLDRLDAATIRAGFPEFAAAGRCRFRDCAHRDEPDCAVRAAAAAGGISAARYASYLRISGG